MVLVQFLAKTNKQTKKQNKTDGTGRSDVTIETTQHYASQRNALLLFDIQQLIRFRS